MATANDTTDYGGWLMPEPTLNQIHTDQPLTDFSFALFQKPETYVASSVFPVQNVAQRSNKYYTYTTADLLRSDARKRAPATESIVRAYKLSKDSYQCERYSVAVDVAEEETANADPALDPEEDAARVAMQDIRIMMDTQWGVAAFTSGIWANETSATWNASTGDPVGDLQTAILTVIQNTGYRPNTLVLGAESWYTGLWASTHIIDRLPDNAPRIVTEGFIKDLFGFEKVFVLNGISNTAIEGVSGSLGFIAEDHALVCYVDPGAGLREPTAGKTFVWSGLTGGGGPVRTKRIEMPEKSALRIETDVAFDFKVVSTDLGYLIKHVVSSS